MLFQPTHNPCPQLFFLGFAAPATDSVVPNTPGRRLHIRLYRDGPAFEETNQIIHLCIFDVDFDGRTIGGVERYNRDIGPHDREQARENGENHQTKDAEDPKTDSLIKADDAALANLEPVDDVPDHAGNQAAQRWVDELLPRGVDALLEPDSFDGFLGNGPQAIEAVKIVGTSQGKLLWSDGQPGLAEQEEVLHGS